MDRAEQYESMALIGEVTRPRGGKLSANNCWKCCRVPLPWIDWCTKYSNWSDVAIPNDWYYDADCNGTTFNLNGQQVVEIWWWIVRRMEGEEVVVEDMIQQIGGYELQQHDMICLVIFTTHCALLLHLNDTPLQYRKNLPCHETAEGDRGMTW